MFSGINQGNSNIQRKKPGNPTSNLSNLVPVVGGSAGPGVNLQQIVPVKVASNINPNKRKRNRGAKKKKKNQNFSWQPSTAANPSKKMSNRPNPNQNAGSRIDLPFDRPDFGRKNAAPLTPNKQLSRQESSESASTPQVYQERIPQNFTFSALPKAVHMSVGTTIYLDLYSQATYEPGKLDFDRKTLLRHDLWHQIVVHHNGRFRKTEILKSLFSLCPTQEMFPIGYREYDLWDSFLLTASDKSAIEILFAKNLKLQIRDTQLCVSVQLGAGNIETGQVHPKAQIIMVCQELLEEATQQGNKHVLNMEGFEKHSALAEVCISFANKYHLEIIIKSLVEHDHAIESIKGIKFANCGLEKIDSFRLLTYFPRLEYIDLKNNQLESIYELKHLEKLKLTDLDVAGNAFAEKEELTHLQERIKKMLPMVKYLDGMELLIRIKKEPGLGGGDDLDFDILFDGELITVNDDLNTVHAYFKQRYKNSNYWHKVRVYHNGYYNRKQIVSKLLALVENNDFYPCYYSSTSQFDEFYVHNHLEALDILVRNKLCIKSTGNEAPLQLMLNMNVAPFKIGQVDVSEKFQKISLESLDNNKELHLNNVAGREIFKNVIIDMSCTRVVSQILLWASRKVGQSCTTIHLNNNGIVSCKGLAPFSWFTKLTTLNLRNNQLESFERLNGMPQPNKITSVILEGNPLCNVSMQQYVKNVRHYFPEIKTLDGAPINSEIFMLARQNYLCKPEAYTFVEAFVKHYFSIYDSNQKHLLKEMYMDKAIFTMSTCFDTARSKGISRMTKYTSKARNIIRLTNLDQATRNVVVGPEEIVKTLIDIHTTEHYFMSFCIDVPIYTKTFIAITINGIFKDKPMQFLDDEFLIHFTRSFTIRPCDSCMGVSGLSQQFKIQNDMLLVRNVSAVEKKLIEVAETPVRDDEEEMKENEMENLVVVFQEMTKLNKNWCDRFLREANWNFKVALNFCVKLLEDNEIPDDAFMKN